MRKRIVCALWLASLLTIAAAAQMPSEAIARIGIFRPKPGMTRQFEQGRKTHNEWHRKQNDQWTWNTWEVVIGENTGQYITGTFGHKWEDFDTWASKFEQADTADAATNLEPYTAYSVPLLSNYRADVSRPPAGDTPTALAQVIHFRVKQDGEMEFNQAIRKTHEAIQKTNWPAHYLWYELVSGGEQPHFVLVLPHNSWADFKELEPSFDKMLENGLGKEEAQAVLKSFGTTIESQRSEVLRYRPDLSYRPAAKAATK